MALVLLPGALHVSGQLFYQVVQIWNIYAQLLILCIGQKNIAITAIALTREFFLSLRINCSVI